MECQIKWHPHEFGIQSIEVQLLLLHMTIQRRPNNNIHLGGWLHINLRSNWDRINKHFEVKFLGQLSIIIGVKVHQEDHLIEISQTHYIDTLLKKYRLQDANPVSTPMDPNIKLDALEGEASEDSEDQLLINHSYANLIRSLMYLTIATQPNIAYLVNKLIQYMLAPKEKHWTAVKRIFRYLKGTRQYKLTYGGSLELLHDKINITVMPIGH